MTPALLSIRGLRVSIEGEGPPVKAVDGVGLDIAPGERLALVGESGCGKTTLALSIGRLLPRRALIVGGEILFRGKDLTRLSPKELRLIRGKEIAYIFQDPLSGLNPVMSIQEQLIETIRLDGNIPDRTAREKALELLHQVKIPMPEDRLKQYPHELSGGMRQRVMIAIALSRNPSLLIADEPTTALDVTTQSQILELLKELQSARGMSLLLITHDLEAVAPHSDRMAVMYAGRIVETADTQTLTQASSHPYTQALFKCLPPMGGKGAPTPIAGTVPDLRFTPAGCPFHPRCPEVIETCRTNEPTLKPVGPKQSVRCWRREWK